MGDFLASVESALSAKGIKNFGEFYRSSDIIQKTIMKLYGGAFLNRDAKIVMPARCRFKTSGEVNTFQNGANMASATFGSTKITLQKAALDSLLKVKSAVGEINPRSVNSGRRSFETVENSWNEEVLKSRDFYKNANKLSEDDIKVLSTPGEAQIKRVLELEAKGLWFHPDRESKRSLAVYVAIPGASQHLLMTAIDIKEYSDPTVRKTMQANGWYQTVPKDRPHYTYLGDIGGNPANVGLKLEKFEGREFWIPDM